jgi:hypothetical protein
MVKTLVRSVNVYASHTSENFSLLCHCKLTETLLMFRLVISAAKYKICYMYDVIFYGLEGPGSNPGGDEIFRPSRPALGLTQSPVKWVPVLSQG